VDLSINAKLFADLIASSRTLIRARASNSLYPNDSGVFQIEGADRLITARALNFCTEDCLLTQVDGEWVAIAGVVPNQIVNGRVQIWEHNHQVYPQDPDYLFIYQVRNRFINNQPIPAVTVPMLFTNFKRDLLHLDDDNYLFSNQSFGVFVEIGSTTNGLAPSISPATVTPNTGVFQGDTNPAHPELSIDQIYQQVDIYNIFYRDGNATWQGIEQYHWSKQFIRSIGGLFGMDYCYLIPKFEYRSPLRGIFKTGGYVEYTPLIVPVTNYLCWAALDPSFDPNTNTAYGFSNQGTELFLTPGCKRSPRRDAVGNPLQPEYPPGFDPNNLQGTRGQGQEILPTSWVPFADPVQGVVYPNHRKIITTWTETFSYVVSTASASNPNPGYTTINNNPPPPPSPATSNGSWDTGYTVRPYQIYRDTLAVLSPTIFPGAFNTEDWEACLDILPLQPPYPILATVGLASTQPSTTTTIQLETWVATTTDEFDSYQEAYAEAVRVDNLPGLFVPHPDSNIGCFTSSWSRGNVDNRQSPDLNYPLTTHTINNIHPYSNVPGDNDTFYNQYRYLQLNAFHPDLALDLSLTTNYPKYATDRIGGHNTHFSYYYLELSGELLGSGKYRCDGYRKVWRTIEPLEIVCSSGDARIVPVVESPTRSIPGIPNSANSAITSAIAPWTTDDGIVCALINNGGGGGGGGS
jgi:hypothetical protein